MKIEIYVHASRDDAWENAEKAGLQGEAAERASFLGYEHKLTFEVNPETGEGELVAVDDRKLGEKYEKEKAQSEV